MYCTYFIPGFYGNEVSLWLRNHNFTFSIGYPSAESSESHISFQIWFLLLLIMWPTYSLLYLLTRWVATLQSKFLRYLSLSVYLCILPYFSIIKISCCFLCDIPVLLHANISSFDGVFFIQICLLTTVWALPPAEFPHPFKKKKILQCRYKTLPHYKLECLFLKRKASDTCN